MISTEFYNGQGLGNQLWCYVTTRVIALDRGYDFGITSTEKFLGSSFLKLDFGKKVDGIKNHYDEKKIVHPLNGSDIRVYDEKLVHVADNTKIDGYMQDEQYILHRKEEIKKWLKVEKEFDCYDYSSDDICIINFRGSGYVQEKDFFLTKKYWRDAIANMRKINPNFKFVVVTEDVRTAKKFFPNFEVNHWTIAKDYSVIKNAHYLILSNSSFAQFPVWTSETLKYCIAPKYWGRHNISDGYWSLGYNIMTGLMYQDRKGNLEDYDSCLGELKEYEEKNKNIFSGIIPYHQTMDIKIKNTRAIYKAFRGESSTLSAFVQITRLVGLKTMVGIKRKIWITFGPATKNTFLKSTRALAKKVSDFKERTLRHMRWDAREREAKKTWLSPAEIAEYRKKIKIYDAFNFFNELELLEIRLNILDPYVDHFVIVESTMTHSGLPKRLFYKENKDLFKKFENKIIHFVIDKPIKDFADARERAQNETDAMDKAIIQEALSSDNVSPSAPSFLRDFYEKECVKKALVGLTDNDICFVSDLDEIWNPELIIDYSKDDIFKLRQTGYVYYLNNRSTQEDWGGWTGTIVTKYKNIKDACLNHLRTQRKMKSTYVFLRNGGWHFTFQGGAERVKSKIESYSHQELNNDTVKSRINDALLNNKDIRGRNFKFQIDEKNLPKYLIENKEKYKKLFK